MKTRISRWGNSLAIRIPASFAQEIDLADGTTVELSVQDGHLRLAPVRPAYEVEALVAGITDDNLHDETDWGTPTGNEAW